MKVIFTCGGTGGHINPAIAVANVLRERRPNCQILFVGGNDGIECDLVPKAGYPLKTLDSTSFLRGLRPSHLWHNVKGVFRVMGALRKAGAIIREEKPDVIVGTGGYASFPMLRQGAKKGIPTCVHESNAVPGLTTRMVADQVDRIMVCFEESRKNYSQPDKVEVVGMPVRQEFIYTKKEEARRRLGLDERPLIVSAWGSMGAREMNKIMAGFFRLEAKEDAYQHVHATGSFGWRWMPEYVKEQGVDLSGHPNIDMREYIFDMPTLMAAADLIISRAGASTLNEIAASGTPCIIVPSPNVTDNHQEKNARILGGRGAATVILEKDCTPEVLFREAEAILKDPQRQASMRKALLDMAVVDSAEKICSLILSLAGRK